MTVGEKARTSLGRNEMKARCLWPVVGSPRLCCRCRGSALEGALYRLGMDGGHRYGSKRGRGSGSNFFRGSATSWHTHIPGKQIVGKRKSFTDYEDGAVGADLPQKKGWRNFC